MLVTCMLNGFDTFLSVGEDIVGLVLHGDKNPDAAQESQAFYRVRVP